MALLIHRRPVPSTALNFFGANDVVNHGSALNLDQQSIWTKIWWCKPAALAGGNTLWRKGDPSHIIQIDASGEIVANVRRSTAEDLYVTNNSTLSVGVHSFIAVSYDSASVTGQRFNISLGTRNSPPVELTYVTTDEGSGTIGDDSAENYEISSSVNAWDGDISWHGNFNSLLTSGNIRSIWRDLRLAFAFDPIIFTYYGVNGPGRQINLSGNNNHGLTTGTKLSQGPPHLLRELAPRRLWVDDNVERNKRRSAFSPLPVLTLLPVPDGVID